MNSRLPGLLCLIGAASLTTPVALAAAITPSVTPAMHITKENADDSANPYSVIVERNIFHLNPPPPPPPPVDTTKADLPVVKITGFVNVGDVRKVLFVAQPKDKKEDPIYYSLTEGEKVSNGKHDLTLVRIHPRQDGVDVIADGTSMNLTLKDDSLLPSTTAPETAAATKGEPTPVNPANRGANRQMFQQNRLNGPGGTGIIPSRNWRGGGQP